MSKYPKVKFGDFVEHIVREVELEADKEYPSVGVKWYGEGVHIHEIKSGGSFNASRFEIKANDIIYNDMWARNGSVAIVPSHLDGTVASSHFPTFLPDLTRVLPKYLEFYFKTRTFWDDCENASRGSTGRNQIKKSTFYAIEIPLPLLTEQHRIVAHIESLAARVNEAQRLREEADLETGVLLSRATTFAIDEKNWEIRKLETVIKESPRNGLAPQAKVGDGGKKMLRINAVSSAPDRYVDLSAFNIVDVPEETAKPFYMQNNEVFVVRYNGDINRLAKAAIYKAKDDEKVIYPDKLIRLRANEEIILPDYLVYALGSRKVRSQIEELGKTTAGNLGISGTNIKSFMLPVPPLEEQRRIVAYLDGLQAKVNALRELQVKGGEELSALMASVLDRAFKGEL